MHAYTPTHIHRHIHIQIHIHVHVQVHVHTWLLWRLPRSRFDGIHAVTSLWRSIGFSRVIGKHRKHMGKRRKTMFFSNKNMGCSWISLRPKHWNSDKRSAPYVMGDDTSVLATWHFFGICSWDMSWTKIEVGPSAKSPRGPGAHFCWQFSCHVWWVRQKYTGTKIWMVTLPMENHGKSPIYRCFCH